MRSAIVTISDRSFAGERPDLSGPLLRNLVEKAGGSVIETILLPDDLDRIAQTLIELTDVRGCELIFTTGGTGLSPRDRTPEATERVIERRVPGMEEALRQESLKKTPFGMLSRGIVGVRKRTLILNFPGSPKAVRECFALVAPILKHALALLRDEDPHTAEARQ